MDALYLPARAKLNLQLRIVGRRADGYHLLETLFHAVELHDDVFVARVDGDGIALAVAADGPRTAVPAGADNLVVRALAALTAAAGEAVGFRVLLRKRIPAGGGLGGGSSDAAAALRLGNELLDEPLSAQQLFRIGAALGADVPFFFFGQSQWGRGVGDELSPVAVPASHFVLLVPPFDCPTAEVYKNHAAHWNDGGPQGRNAAASIPSTGPCNGSGALRIQLSNDLERAAEIVRPALAVLRRRAAEMGKVSVHLTGSGSTLFVACDGEQDAIRCVRDLEPLRAEGVDLLRTRSAPRTDVPVTVPWPDEGHHDGIQPWSGSAVIQCTSSRLNPAMCRSARRAGQSQRSSRSTSANSRNGSTRYPVR